MESGVSRWSARWEQCRAGLSRAPKLFADYIFSSPMFAGRPRNGADYLKLLQLNCWAAIATIMGGVCLYEFSTVKLAQAMNKSAIFPLYFPHAIGLALACKFQGSVLLGNFAGYYFARVYLVAHGPAEMILTRSLELMLIAFLGVLETHTGAWLLHRYVCLAGNTLPKTVPTIDNVQQAFWYIMIVLGTTLLFDTPIAVVACLTEIVPWHSFGRFWITWWFGVVAGMLTLSPAIIHLLAIGIPIGIPKPPNAFNVVKTIVLWGAVVGALILLFFQVQHFVRPLPYLVYPLIVFASFRFNYFGWAIVLAVISFCCALGTLHRNNSLYYMAGAPVDKSSPGLILQIELFVSVMGLVAIVLAAAVKEKAQLTDDLNKANEDLEETVATRTSELVKANNELRLSQKRAEHASHAKSDFLANMSHEIRTPIHGILGLTTLLLDSKLTADQRESLMSVKECADLLLHIINSVLDLSKIEAGRLEAETVLFSIRKTVSSTLRMMEAQAHAHNLQLLWHIDGTVPDRVVGDPGKLQQCILNLVGNALKFTNEGSVTVHVSLSTRKVRHKNHPEREDNNTQPVVAAAPKAEAPPLFPRPPKPPSSTRLAKLRSWRSWPGAFFRAESGKSSQSCTIDVHESSDIETTSSSTTTNVVQLPAQDEEICSQPSTPETVDVEFEVHDTGIGISKEKLQDMFNPFTQADASTSRLYGGTGLGLCIVQRFVELLGGTIWAESEVNKGSTFGFRVPFRLSSDPNFTYKPQPKMLPRFSSLEAPTSSRGGPKNGLQRRAYSVDVLMRNMKFTLPLVVEGQDGEESVSGSSDADIREISIQQGLTTEDLSSIPRGSTTEDPGSTMKSHKLHKFGSSKGSGSGTDIWGSSIPRGPTTEDPGSSTVKSHKSHKFEKSYVQFKSSEVEHSKLSEASSSTDGPECTTHSTAIRCVGDSTEGTPLEENASIEVPGLDKSSVEVEKPSPSPLLPQLEELSLPLRLPLPLHPVDVSVPPPKSRVLASATKAGSAKGLRRPDGERALHILLAEDNPINQKVATRQLQRYGHKVSIVGDGKQALDAVELDHEGYDVVLMDVQMPNMDGLQATQSIRELETQRSWARLPILGLTAHAIQGYQETCLSHGMDGYLGKPFEIKQLLEHMRKLTTRTTPRDNG